MKLISATVVSVLAATALGADCFGQPQSDLGKTFGDAYWDARAKMCGNSDDCHYQKDCTTYSAKTVQGLIKLTTHVSIKRQKLGGTGGFKDCWDATEDIINQCIYGTGQMSGTWAYNGQLYQISSYFTG
ncbi:Sulfite reductase [Purpureocillium lavendulum]|uniref:Sulfite reductase n=1 Tax=Purpureocillium lavendulum TaxID=1247861 RepID=A0AB34FW60_9HYPO|nr:Sulfite reductase [Purpureocillium lavendulum]